MSSITLSAATRQNLLSLQDTASLLSTTQNRLSTGKKVNSALDNPVNYFTSQSLDSRSSALSSLLDGISNGIQVIQAANQGITAMRGLTSQLTSLTSQALASANAFTSKSTTTSTATGLTNANILGGTATAATSAGTAVTGMSGTTALNSASSPSVGVASGDTFTVNGQTITVTAATSGAQDATHVRADDSVQTLLTKIDALAGTTSTISAGGAITIANNATSGNLTIGGTGVTKLGLTATTGAGIAPTTTGGLTGTLTVQVGTGTTSTVQFGTGLGQVSTLDGLNAILNQNGAQASIDSGGHLAITTTNESGTQNITLGGAAATSFGSPTSAAIGGDGQTARAALVTNFNNLLTQIDQQAKDSSFNGVNLLNGDNLKINFNEDSSSNLNVQGSAITSAGLGLNTLSASDFNDSNSINAVAEKINSAVSQLKSQSAAYGANLAVVQNRQTFTNGMINVLDTGSANLVNADMNEEAANSQALSTRNSLGISALSLANQAQQGVLQLLR